MTHDSNLVAPDDDELFAYALGDEMLDEEKLQHLQLCSICQKRFRNYQHLDKKYLSYFYRALCPDSTRLILYCKDALPANEKSEVDEHLGQCFLCADEVRDIRYELARFTLFPEPGSHPFQRFVSSTLRLLIAQPVFQRSEMVLRQASSETSWPWRYQAQGFTLSFQLWHTEKDQLKLIGFFENCTEEQLTMLGGVAVDLYRVLSSQDAPRDQLAGQEESVASTTVDDLGNFAFASLLPGNYLLVVHLPDAELVVDGLPIT